MAKRISKSQFMMGLQCLKRLWLYNYRKDLIPPVDAAKQKLFDEGHAVDVLSRDYFKGGKLVEFDYRQLPEALEYTARLIEDGAKLIYEGAFTAADVLIRCDILKKNPDGGWDLIEVKSSASVKEEHLPDAALQRYVLQAAGLKIKKVWLMHLDNTYVKQGPIDPQKIFKREDITAETSDLLPVIKEELQRFLEALAVTDTPEIGIGRHCSTPYECEFRGHCWKDMPEYSIYDIPRLSWEKKNTLKAMGIINFRDVPETFDLNAAQRLYLRVEKTGRPAIDGAALASFLEDLDYPLYHIDFETLMPGIPLYDGSRPYQQIPFQVSLHVQDRAGAEARHFEYLGDPGGDPRPGLIDFMAKNIGPKGSLLAYNSAFEASRLKELAEDFPASKTALSNLIGRMTDLMQPFRRQAYVDPQFHGRCSLKVVLPAMVPDMSYKNLPIANGGDAQLAYSNMVAGKLDPAEAERTRRDLKIYCGQDTMAMVKILEKLYTLARSRR
jgi:hypothetical protein